MVHLNDPRFWLYAAVNADTNDLLHTPLEPTRTNVLATTSLTELREKHAVDDAVFLVDGAPSLYATCRYHDFHCRNEHHGDRNNVERVFRELK